MIPAPEGEAMGGGKESLAFPESQRDGTGEGVVLSKLKWELPVGDQEGREHGQCCGP